MSWLPGWSKRVKVTVDSGDIDAALTHFPTLLYLSASSGINSDDVSFIFDELQSDANRKKIAVTKADGLTKLYVEIEKWDDANEEAWLWVSNAGWDIASGADTDLFLYYDSSHVDNTTHVGDPNSAPAEKVWNTAYVLVSHMQDDPDTSSVRDSTSNNNDGIKKGANEPQVTVSGQMDDAQDFDGADDYVEVADHGTLNPNEVTLEGWVKWKSKPGAFQSFLSKWDGTNGYEFAPIPTAHKFRWVVRGSDNTAYIIQIVGTPTIGVWYHWVGTYGGTKMRGYLDTVLQDEKNVPVGIKDSIEHLIFGTSGRAPIVGDYCDVVIDEVRVSNVARSAAWVLACYETQRDHLLDYGLQETVATIGGSIRIKLPQRVIQRRRRKKKVDWLSNHHSEVISVLELIQKRRRNRIINN